MFSWFKDKKRKKMLKALEARCVQECYENLHHTVSSMKEDMNSIDEKLDKYELMIDRNSSEIKWLEEKIKIANRLISILQETSDYEVEYISEHNLWTNKKERKAQLAQDGYSFFTCVDGDEIWKRRKS